MVDGLAKLSQNPPFGNLFAGDFPRSGGLPMLRRTLIACALLSSTASAQEIGSINAASGQTLLLRDGASVPANVNDAIRATDVIRTGEGGRLRVALKDGSTLIVGASSELRVALHDTDAQKTLVELLHGHVRVHVQAITKHGGVFLIRTPTAETAALGTELEVASAATVVSKAEIEKLPLPRALDLSLLDNKQQPLGGAAVALALANEGKIPAGTTDAQGNVSIALNLANLNKVAVEVQVDECDDGQNAVWLVGPNAQPPQERSGCKRRKLSGVVIWGQTARVMVNLGTGALVVADPTGAVAESVSSLTDVAPGALPNSGVRSMADYASDGGTVVVALDHRAMVSNIDRMVGGTSFLMPTDFTVVVRGQKPAPPASFWEDGRVTPRFTEFRTKFGDEIGRFDDFDGGGHPCVGLVVLNGLVVSGAPGQAGKDLDEPLGTFKLVGNGVSTGEALTLHVTNLSPCVLHFLVTDGVILSPKGFTERVITGLILGNPPIKNFQKMITMGGMVFVVSSPRPGAAPGSMAVPGGGTGSMPLRAYCLELHKLAPHQKTEYRFASHDDQRELGVNRAIVDRAFRMHSNRELTLPPTETLDGAIQWTLWASRENMSQKDFHEQYTNLVEHNYEAKKQKIDKALKEKIERSGQDLWTLVQTIGTGH
jgi:FecR protein